MKPHMIIDEIYSDIDKIWAQIIQNVFLSYLISRMFVIEDNYTQTMRQYIAPLCDTFERHI